MRRDIIGFFEKGIFPFKDNVFKTKKEKSEEEFKKYINNTLTFIKEKSGNINNDLFKTYFGFSTSIDLAKKLFETKDEFVGLIKIRWNNLKGETGKMSEEEIKNEKPNQILEIVNDILDFNKDIQKQQMGWD